VLLYGKNKPFNFEAFLLVKVQVQPTYTHTAYAVLQYCVVHCTIVLVTLNSNFLLIAINIEYINHLSDRSKYAAQNMLDHYPESKTVKRNSAAATELDFSDTEYYPAAPEEGVR
jgi:hypothetical protein